MTLENEFSPAFSTAFDAYTRSGYCYPDSTDWACAYTPDEIANLDPAVKERSEILAWTTLAALTGYQIATCPIEVRPCAEKCTGGTYVAAPVAVGTSVPAGNGMFSPSINSYGMWVNSCGCGGTPSGCSCTVLSEVILPGPVGGILDVLIDGGHVDPTQYRVDNGNRLVAQNGATWPSCQDMSLPSSEDGTFAVIYWRGFAPNPLTNYAAGVLAAEFYKACTGNKACRLPDGVTTVTRQGVTLEIQTGLFANGFTGIREIDAIIETYNPNHLKMPTVVLSPDVSEARTPTWRW